MLNQDGAHEIAVAFLEGEVQPKVDEELVITSIQEYPTCWVVTYNTQTYVKSGKISHSLAGNAPLIINKRTGAARIGLTSTPIDSQLDPY